MLEVIEKLLLVQERDRTILQLQRELDSIGPQQEATRAKALAAHTALEDGRVKARHLESERKKLELEVEARRERIERYSMQQFQTKRNEEYRALAHEIETCKAEIVKLEDQELELMEQAETAQRAAGEAAKEGEKMQQHASRQLAELATREATLQRHLAEAVAGREPLAAAAGEAGLAVYERLRKSKGERVIAGVEHGACGGCHMKLPAQVVLACRGAQDIVTCPNCGRILYYTRDMDMVVAE
jgi:hypothetical protein